MISRCVISCDECALRFYVCSIFVDRVFVPFIFHHGVHWTYKCFAYVAPRGWIWVRRGLCGFGDIRGSVGRYDPWGIKATGFAVTTKINHYAAVTARPYALRWALSPVEWVAAQTSVQRICENDQQRGVSTDFGVQMTVFCVMPFATMSQPGSPERPPQDSEAMELSPGTDQEDTLKKGGKKKGDKKPIPEMKLTVEVQ